MGGRLAGSANQRGPGGHWRAEDARELSRHAVEGFLPRRGPTSGHRVWKAVDGSGKRVGWIWVGPSPFKHLDEPSKRWLYQITIGVSHQGQGYGRAALA